MSEGAVANVVVLLESFDGSAVTATNTEHAVGKDALGVADVAEEFFHRPFAGGVAKVSVRFVAAGEQKQHLATLRFEGRKDIVAGDERDVAVVVGSVFAGLRTADWSGHEGWIGHECSRSFSIILRP